MNSKQDQKIRKLQTILDKSIGTDTANLDKIDDLILKLDKKMKPI